MESNSSIIARVTHLANKPKAHSHVHHQIVFGLKGHAEFEISELGGYVQKCVGCIVPSNHNHSFFGDEQNKILLLDITENLPLLELDTAFSDSALNGILTSPKYFHYDQELHSLLVALAGELEMVNDDSTAPSVIGQCLLHSLYHRLRGKIDVEEVGSVRNRIDLSRIKRYVYANLSGKITIGDLARFCNLSESHFYQKFREKIGISPYQYVIDERIKASCTMITGTQKPITEICFTLGFSSQSAFTNLFRKKIGMSPTEYREKYNDNSLKSE